VWLLPETPDCPSVASMGDEGAEQEPIGRPGRAPRVSAGLRSQHVALRPRTATAATAVVFLLAGVLFAASSHTAQGTDLRGGRAIQTRDLAARAAQRVEEQAAVVEALQREVADLTAVGGTGGVLAASQRSSARLESPAGLGVLTRHVGCTCATRSSDLGVGEDLPVWSGAV